MLVGVGYGARAHYLRCCAQGLEEFRLAAFQEAKDTACANYGEIGLSITQRMGPYGPDFA